MPNDSTVQGIQSLVSKDSTRTRSYFRYTTFIPDKTAPADICRPLPFPLGKYFSGDNRNYYPEGSFRTRVDVTVPWNSQKISYSRKVSDTLLYRANGKFEARRNAGVKGITVRQMLKDKNTGQFQIVHEVGNPFCAVGAIKYSTLVNMKKDASYYMIGSHRRVPNHEVYVRHNVPNIWYGIYHHTSEGFGCLISDTSCGGIKRYSTHGISIP